MESLVAQANGGFPTSAPVAQTSVGMAVVARATQEIQAAVFMAKQFPRDQGAALKRIEGACQRIALAEVSMYSYERGGTAITGPSIRLAEVCAQNWGNIQFGFVVTHQTAKYSDVSAYCWDVETNTRRSIEFRCNHWRDTKDGGYPIETERDIYELVANMASRRVRNCVLAVIPGDVVEAAVNMCEHTLKNRGDIVNVRIKLVAAFKSEFSVSEDAIETKFGRKITSLTSIDVIQLRKIYQSIKDGMSTKEEWFPPVTDPLKFKNMTENAPPSATNAMFDKIAGDEKKVSAKAAYDEQRVRIQSKWGVDAVTILKTTQAKIDAASPVALQAYADILKQWADKEESPA